MRAALAALLVALLAVGAAPAAAQLPATIQTLLEKPELRPFINKVRGQLYNAQQNAECTDHPACICTD